MGGERLIPLNLLKSKLGAAADATRYRLHFAALLREAAGMAPDEFFVVGGSAIEIYTAGEYTSGDIDITSSENERLRAVVAAWGFKREGRVWQSEDLGLVVDFVRWPYAGNMKKTTEAATPHGPVRLAAVEDLLVKRLASAKHWNQHGDQEHAKLLAFEFFERIDWDYVRSFAREHDVEALAEELRTAVAKARAAGAK